jgi:hypothetical protein
VPRLSRPRDCTIPPHFGQPAPGTQLPPRPAPGSARRDGRGDSADLSRRLLTPMNAVQPARSCGSPVCSKCGDHTGLPPIAGPTAAQSVPADLERPREKGSSDPCPAHTRVAKLLLGPESLEGGRSDLRASIPLEDRAKGVPIRPALWSATIFRNLKNPVRLYLIICSVSTAKRIFECRG